jgi:hypothetical protein
MTAPRIKPTNVPLATLFERTTHDGRQYLVGRIGDARILILATDRRSRGDRVWQAVVAPGPHAPAVVDDTEIGGQDG